MVDLKQVCVTPHMTIWLSTVVETVKLRKKKNLTRVQICNLSHGFHHSPILTVFSLPARAKKRPEV